MEKDSALYQLMDTRMHSVMNGIMSSDGEYQAILRKSDIYSGELDRMDLSKEIRLLIDRGSLTPSHFKINRKASNGLIFLSKSKFYIARYL